MAVRKIAISVPEQVLERVDRIAKKTGTTRSGFITRVLVDVSRAASQAEITERINRAFEDPAVLEEQLRTSRDFLRASENTEDEDW